MISFKTVSSNVLRFPKLVEVSRNEVSADAYEGTIIREGENLYMAYEGEWIPVNVPDIANRVGDLETVSIKNFRVDGPSVYELGVTESPTFRWSHEGVVNPASQSINGTQIDALANYAFVTMNNSRDVTLSVTSPNGDIRTETVSIKFVPKVYYGFVSTPTPNSQNIIAGQSVITDKLPISDIITPNDGKNYVFIAIPSSMPIPKAVTLNGFRVSTSISTVSVTSSAGRTGSYNLIIVPTPQSGSAYLQVL